MHTGGEPGGQGPASAALPPRSTNRGLGAPGLPPRAPSPPTGRLLLRLSCLHRGPEGSRLGQWTGYSVGTWTDSWAPANPWAGRQASSAPGHLMRGMVGWLPARLHLLSSEGSGPGDPSLGFTLEPPITLTSLERNLPHPLASSPASPDLMLAGRPTP